MEPVIVVVGPTGSGKTSLAIEIAEQLGGEILSADSMQFYRGMEIGTAAPNAEEQARVPHHFVSFINPDELMAAGRYQSLGRACLNKLQQAGKRAVVVGGSGLYVNALIDGLFEGPGRDEGIRNQLMEEAAVKGNEALMEQLRDIDPDYAAQLSSANDLIRIVRALEVHAITGTPYSVLHEEHQRKADRVEARFFALEWDRAQLYERINARVDSMVAAGWVEEVQTLVEEGYGPSLESLKALGYREIAQHLEGNQSLEDAIEATKMHHRRYAKRQLTWFRGDKRIHWLPYDGTAPVKDLADNCLSQA